jgi:hypothetical protein
MAMALASGALLLAAAAIPAALLRLVTRGFRLRSRGRPASAADEPPAQPIEELAVQLRRLAAVLTQEGPVSAVRRFGVERAYDELLARACSALGVPHQLTDVDLDDRTFERLRVESTLQEFGLVLREPRPQPSHRHDGR